MRIEFSLFQFVTNRGENSSRTKKNGRNGCLLRNFAESTITSVRDNGH